MKKGLLDGFLTLSHNKKIVSGILTAAIFIVGLASLPLINRAEMPVVESPIYIVRVIYPGVSTEEMEQNVILPMEDVLKGIVGIDNFTSFSAKDSGRIFVTLDTDNKDMQSVADELYRKMSVGNIPDIDTNLESISVEEAQAGSDASYAFGIYPQDPTMSYKELYKIADAIKLRLEQIADVESVTVEGARDEEVHINVNPDLASSAHVSMTDIVNAIKARNNRTTVGNLKSVDEEQTIVSINQYEQPLDVADTVIRAGFDGNQVLLSDIAAVRLDYPELLSIAHINGKRGLIIKLNKQSDADVINTVSQIKELLADPSVVPSSVVWEEYYNTAEDVQFVLRVMLNNGLIGFVLILIILFIFLDFKTAFWTAFGLPISFLLTLAYMNLTNMTVNQVSMAAMITIIGMLVDHGIVIAESIYTRRKGGFSALQASIDGLNTVFWALVVTVASTIAAFLPLFIVSGLMGKILRIFPIIISTMLIFSFFEACVLLTSHLQHMKVKKRDPAAPIVKRDWFSPVVRGYRIFLKQALRFRYLTLILLLGLVFLCLQVARKPLEKFELFYNSEERVYSLRLEAPPNTSIEKMERLSLRVEEKLNEVIPADALKLIVTNIGDGSVNGFNRANLEITFKRKAETGYDNAELIERVKEAINTRSFPEFISTRIGFNAPGPGGRAISIELRSDNISDLVEVSTELEEILSGIGGAYNISNDYDKKTAQIQIDIDYAAAARYGLSIQNIANTLRTAYNGTTATSIQGLDGKLDFKVFLDERFKSDDRYLYNLDILSSRGTLVPLQQVASLRDYESSPRIRHIDGLRAITISGDANTEIATSLQIVEQLELQAAAILRAHPNVIINYGGEAEASQRLLGDLPLAFAVALILIYLTIALLFNSYIQPLMVMLAIPFGLLGALVALHFHNIPMSMMGMIGMMGLMGVVVNDSVVMVDFINKVTKNAKNLAARKILPLILKGAGKRLRPVVLTTLTTVLGLLPTVYGLGGDPGFVRPVTLVLAYGILFATIITLIFIPVIYLILHDLRYLLLLFRELLNRAFKLGEKSSVQS